MAQKFDALGFRENIEPQKTTDSGSGLTIFLACICLAFLGAFGSTYYLMSGHNAGAAQTSRQTQYLDPEIGQRRWTALKALCEKKAFRRHKDGGAMIKQIEQQAMLMGITSGSAGRLVLCIGAPSARNFCNAAFRAKFTRLVEYERSLAGKGPSDMERFNHTMMTQFGGKRTKTSIHAREKISRRIRTLLRKGLLRREDFSNYLYGEPEWLTKMLGNRKQPNPCETF